MRIFRALIKDQKGATAIEYGLIAAVIGTGLAVSASYVVDGMQSMVKSSACAIDSPLSLAQREKFGCDEDEAKRRRQAEAG
ncbi:MAG: Flp/Fap pilin component [Pseudomonadota bacterium]|jgi:Flp pilus assembly pilin Flp